MRAAGTALLFSLAVILELLASRYGLMPPVTAVCACCMAMRTGGWRVLLPSLAAAAFTDALWGHAFPSRSCAALFAILLASAWRRYGDVNTWGGMVLTVPAVGLVSWCGSMLASPLAGTPFVGWSVLVTQMLWCAALMPMTASLLDLCFKRRLEWYSVIFAEDAEESGDDD